MSSIKRVPLPSECYHRRALLPSEKLQKSDPSVARAERRKILHQRLFSLCNDTHDAIFQLLDICNHKEAMELRRKAMKELALKNGQVLVTAAVSPLEPISSGIRICTIAWSAIKNFRTILHFPVYDESDPPELQVSDMRLTILAEELQEKMTKLVDDLDAVATQLNMPAIVSHLGSMHIPMSIVNGSYTVNRSILQRQFGVTMFARES